MKMADNHVRGDASAEEDEGFSAVETTLDARAESGADSVDEKLSGLRWVLAMQMANAGPTKGSASDSINNEPKEMRAVEDGVREDTFVDCPDEIENSESQVSSEEKDMLQEDPSNESDSGIKVREMVAEIELLRDKLEKSVSEKEQLAQGYEDERANLRRELSYLCYQLKVSNEQQIMADENAEVVPWDVGSHTSLHEMISECSRFLKNAADERQLIEEKVRELHSSLYSKDQEIDFLNAKVADLTESSNIVQSNSASKLDNLSQLYEVQLEKDQQIEEITNRILASLSTVHYQEPWGESLTEKISNLEKSVTVLVEKYNSFISESGQLRECLNEVGLDFNQIDEIGTFHMARDKILELRRKEDDIYQNLSSSEDEKRKLVEELEKQKSTVEKMNAEIGRLSAEVEQEKNRYANTKEKLSMAVTKGKALVQKRDSLNQSLLEKTSQLEKISVELEEKTSALEASEKTKELVLSLQESLAEKETVLQKCGEILLESFEDNELQPTDISEKLRWLADENKSLKDTSLQFRKLTDALLSFDFPEIVASSELDERVRWIAESFYQSKEEAAKLQSETAEAKEAAKKVIEHLTTSLLAEIQDKSYLQAELEDIRSKYEAHERLQHELAEGREAVNNEIDRLTTSLLAESQEKSYLQLELENLRREYEEVIEKERLSSLQREKIISILLEASGLTKDDQGEVRPENSDMIAIIHNCLGKIREHASPREPSLVEIEIFESFKSLLYIRDQEMTLYKLIIEEDVLDKAQASHVSDELDMKTQELNALKDDKAVMQKSLEQLEERCALLKDKLSMAVKKGKGLVQERENLKGSINEKNTEIDTLKSELQQQLSKYADCQDQITRFLLDVECISVLETDLVSTKERVDQLEQLLAESSNMLQRVMEAIEGINTPTNLLFNDPVEKVKWIAEHLSENEISKTQVEQELRNVKDEASSLASKLFEVQTMMKSLEEALSIAESRRSELLDEKKELEVSKALLEEELQNEKEKASSRTSEFEELFVRKTALEEALSLAEDNASRFINERDTAAEGRTLAEEQINKLNEDLSDHVAKLAAADKTIQSLEDALSQAQKNILLLSDENSKVQVGRADLDGEIQRIREEADSYARKFSEASMTIKSLEDSLLNAENNITDLVQEKKNAEQEAITLNSKLESLTDELSRTRGSMENHSLELSDQLSRLQLLLEDETLSTLLGQCFQKNIESLKGIHFLLKEMWDCFLDMDSDVLQTIPIMEDGSPLSTTLPFNSDIASTMEMSNGEVNAFDTESISVHIEKMVERFHLKGKALADKCENLSTLMDESVATLLRRLRTTKDKLLGAMKYINFVKDKLEVITTDKKMQDDTIVSLESDIQILSSACTDATKGLELNVRKMVSELRYIHESVVNIDGISVDLGAVEDDAAAALAIDQTKKAEKLLLATRQNQDLTKLFQDAISKLMSMADDMQNRLKETQRTYDEVLEERDLYKDKILKLESDLIAQQNLYHETTIKLEEYKEREDGVRKREAELSTSSSKDHEFEDTLSASQVKSILDKINQVNVPDAELALGDSHDSANVRKLFYVMDSFSESLQKVSSLSHENEELQSTVDQQILEIEQLKRQVDDYMDKEKVSLQKLSSLSHENEDLQSTIDQQILEINQLKRQVDDYMDKEKVSLQKLSSLSHENEDLQSTIDQHILEIEQLKSQVNDYMDKEKVSLQKISTLFQENEELQSTTDQQILEIEQLKRQVEDYMDNEKDSGKLNKLSELESGLQVIVRKLGGDDLMDDSKVDGATWLVPLLDKLVTAVIVESEGLKHENEELVAKLLGAQQAVDDLSNKVQSLEESNQPRAVLPEINQDRGSSVSSLSAQPEISEMQDMATHGKSNNIPSVSSAAHVRSLRKGSSDHLAINIESDTERLINDKGSDEDKGHLFKSLVTSGLVPRQGRTVADRIDAMWVSGNRALMNRPRGRLGLIAYWLVLHIWLLGSIL